MINSEGSHIVILMDGDPSLRSDKDGFAAFVADKICSYRLCRQQSLYTPVGADFICEPKGASPLPRNEEARQN